jgi:HlyD family secretion protein
MSEMNDRDDSPSHAALAVPRPIASRPRRRRWLKRAVLVAVGLGGVAGVGLTLRPAPISVELATASRGDLVVTVEELARARVRDRYVVSAPLAAEVSRIELRPGDRVGQGDVVARMTPLQPALLDPRSRAEAEARSAAALASGGQARAMVARSEAAARHAADELARTRRLVDDGALPRDALTRAELEDRLAAQELESARFAAVAATHEAKMASAALLRFDPAPPRQDRFEVTSPVDGRVLRVVHQSAGPAPAGGVLLEIGDPDAIEIVADVLTADAVRMAVGAPVTVHRWGGEPLRARVRTIEPSAFTRVSALGVEEQRVPVIIDIDEPRGQWARMGDGFRAEVQVVIEKRDQVVRVPLGAVFREGAGWATYVVADGRAHLAQVSLGARSDAEVEVTGGLTDGQSVIVHPGESVAEGSRIEGR